MNTVLCEQGGAEWLEIRTGKVTASEVADATSYLKRKSNGKEVGESSGTRESYKAALAAEILSGRASEHYVSRHMERGTALEPEARILYESRNNVMVQEVGFVIHPTIERSGASPDGLIGNEGGLEIKAPKLETHIKYIFAGVLPPEYEPQVMWNMACTGRQWWDFASYCPEMPESMRLFQVRVYRDEMRVAELEQGVRKVLEEVDEMVAKLRALHPESEPKQKKIATYDEQFGDLGLTDEDLALIP